MGSHIAAACWLLVAVVTAFAVRLRFSREALAAEEPERLQAWRGGTPLTIRLLSLLYVVNAVLCLAAAVRAVLSDNGSWWLWLLATLAHLWAMTAWRRAGHNLALALGAHEDARPGVDRFRDRRVLACCVVAAGAFLAGDVLLNGGGESPGGVRGVLGSIAVLVAVVAIVAAGWSAVWVFRPRSHDSRG
jgi:hypothetical protein